MTDIMKETAFILQKSLGVYLESGVLVCVCVVCPPVVYILIPSGGLFTPPAGTSSHIVDHP